MDKRAGKSDNLIVSIWFALKRSIFLVLAIVLLCTACGVVYGFVKKPNYTATEEVVFTAEAEDKTNIVINFNIMSAYINTIVDFCDEGVVIDRANYYYVIYQQRLQPGSSYMQDGGYTVDDFIYDIKNVEDPYSINSRVVNRQYIVRDNVYVSAQVETEETDQYSFALGYTDPDKEEAVVKTKIYVMAFIREVQPDADKTGVRYFEGINITILDLDTHGEPTSDVSKVKLAAIGFVVGIVLAAVAVYIVNVTDVTVKSREDLEDITGTAVLAYIQDEGGKR